MKIKNILILIFFFTSIAKINPIIPLNQIRGLAYACNPTLTEGIAPELQQVNGNRFSPLWGAILWNSPYIENLWRYGDTPSNTIQLIKELFFLHHDEITFDATHLPLKIGAYLSLEDIGKIIGYIDNFNTSMYLYSKISESTHKKKLLEEARETLKENIQYLINQLDREKFPIIKDKIIKYLEMIIKRATENLIKLEKQKEELNQDLALFKNEYNIKYDQEKITQIEAQIKTDEFKLKKTQENLEHENAMPEKIYSQAFHDSKVPLIKNLIASLSENSYLPNNTIYILLSFAWAKAENKEEFINLFWGIYSTLENKQNLFKPNIFKELQSQLKHSTNEKQLFKEILQRHLNFSNFEKPQYEALKVAPPKAIKNQIIYDLEDLAITVFGMNLYDQTLPNAVNMVWNANYLGTEFPDCGETSLLNLFIAILYNATTNNWNLDILRAIGAIPSITEFFTKYNPITINLKAAHDDWANIVSGLPGVIYSRNNCDIYPGIPNMLKVISNLIPGVSNFDDLKMRLKTAAIEIEFRPEFNITDKPDDNTINIEIKKPETENFTLIWKFYPGHFDMFFPSWESISHFEQYRKTLKEISEPNNYEKNKKTIFLSLYQTPLTDITALNLGQKFESSYFYTQNLKTNDAKLNYISEIIKTNLNWNPTIISSFKTKLIRSIYNTLPRNDHHTVETFFKLIATSNLDIFDPNDKTFENLTEYEKIMAIKLCILKEKHIEWLKQIIPTIKDDYKLQIFGHILNIPNIQNIELKTFLYNWIKNFLTQIKNETLLLKDLLTTIIANLTIQDPNLNEFLYKWLEEAISKDTGHIDIYISFFLEMPKIENPRLNQFCENWTLKNLNNIWLKSQIITLITKILKSPYIQNSPQKNIFYQWAIDKLSRLNQEESLFLICAILKIPLINNIQLREPFFNFIKEKLPSNYFENDFDLELTIIILNSPNMSDPKLRAACYDWILYIIPALGPDSCQIGLIKCILNIPDANLESIIPIINQIFVNIKLEENKIQLIKTILTELKTENIEIRKIFYEYIKNTIPTIQEDANKFTIIKIILENLNNITLKEYLISTYSWIKTTLTTLPNNRIKKQILDLIAANPIQNAELAVIQQAILKDVI